MRYVLLQSYKSIPPFNKGDVVKIMYSEEEGRVTVSHITPPYGSISIKMSALVREDVV